ncbi:HAD-IIIC family phosphatase [Solibacillus sp. CAU 1738]|uniref:HAD-IIIC family phosphatase n=1 Tax=Solibacillus sp. CAU 1738 TaxID=3140363 RepID=UPI003261A3D6
MVEMDSHERKVKCVVWDLDHTIWRGVLLEDKNVKLREDIKDILEEFDRRGILQSIASKNEHHLAIEKLKEFGIEEYFIYPQINWNSKGASIKKIAKSINIGLDTLAFIDDQPFEREEVSFTVPEVMCIDATDLSNLLDLPEMNPRFLTNDSKNRRSMYLSDIERNKIEESYEGAKEEFLESLNMVLSISPVDDGDLQRAEELTVRTHQLNATGYTYSYEELGSFVKSKKHKLLIADLNDKYGTYGKVGVVLLECDKDVWTLKLLLMSCRVMSRGIGTVMLNYVMHLAKNANVQLRAEFVPTSKNRMMYMTYKFSGFKEIKESDDLVLFENDCIDIQPIPNYIKLNAY